MEQEKVILENPEEIAALEQSAQGNGEPLPYTRREIIFTMLGVFCVVFLSINVFVLSLGVILSGLIAVFFLKEIPLRERKKAYLQQWDGAKRRNVGKEIQV